MTGTGTSLGPSAVAVGRNAWAAAMWRVDTGMVGKRGRLVLGNYAGSDTCWGTGWGATRTGKQVPGEETRPVFHSRGTNLRHQDLSSGRNEMSRAEQATGKHTDYSVGHIYMVGVRAKNHGHTHTAAARGWPSRCPHTTHPTPVPSAPGTTRLMDPRRRGSIVPSSSVTRPGSGPGTLTERYAIPRVLRFPWESGVMPSRGN